MRCHHCGLIYPEPIPKPKDLQDHYGVPPEDYWKPEYFQLHEEVFTATIATAGHPPPPPPPHAEKLRGLDIGVGLGHFMIAFEHAGFEMHGLEPSATFHQRAIEQMRVASDRLRRGAVEELSYPDSSFDFINLNAVLEHLYDPSGVLERVLPWLKPNGVIHVEVPSSDWLIARLGNLYYRLRGTDHVANISPMHEPYHLYEFTLQSFVEHGRRAGYHVAHYQPIIGTTLMSRALDKVLQPIMRWTGTGMEFDVWLKPKQTT